MDLISLVYDLITLAAGVFCLGGLFVSLLRQKNEVLRHYFVFYGAFSAFMLMTVIRAYFREGSDDASLMSVLTHVQLALVFLSLFLFVSLINRVLIVPAGRIVNIILLGCTIVAYIWGLQEKDAFQAGYDEIFDILMLLYSLVVYLVYKKNVKNEVLRRSMRYAFFSLLLFIPGLILDEVVLGHGSKLHTVPILYVAIGIFTFLSFREIQTSVDSKKIPEPGKTSPDFGFTEREAEVADLLLRGYSYARIAQTLVISISTVRTHVTSIYKKAAVNSRYELMNLF